MRIDVALSIHLALAASALSSFACGDSETPVHSAANQGGLIGSTAPDFNVKPIGKSKDAISLSGLRGHVVMVDFWGTFCEPCKKSFPKLERYA